MASSDGPAGIALVYHRVGPVRGDRENELLPALDLDRFRAQLDQLAENFEPVTASGLFEAAGTWKEGKAIPVALTFDDDLASHAEWVLPELSRRDWSATFFLGGNGLGEGGPRPWWELLESAARKAPDEALGGRSLRAAAAAIEAMTPQERSDETARLERLAGSDVLHPPLDREGIAALVDAGMEIGFHTLEHHRLSDLDEESLDRALTQGREQLEQVCGPIGSIAYPHGASSPRVVEAARRAGYDWGFNTNGTALTSETDPLDIGRIYPRDLAEID